jgi:endonuclease G
MSRRDSVQQAAMRLAVAAGLEWERSAPSIASDIDLIGKLGPLGAESDERAGRFAKRETLRANLTGRAPFSADFVSLGYERVFGPTLDYSLVAPPSAPPVGKSVARLVDWDGGGGEKAGFASGFMVSPRLLMTNHHVFQERDAAMGAWAQFGYETLNELTRDGLAFRLRPDLFFFADEALDLALVQVDEVSANGQPLAPYPFLVPIPTEGKIAKGRPVHLISHPKGAPRTYVFKGNPLVRVTGDRLQYLSDSDRGSSGCPAFNEHWELVALHSGAIPRMEGEKVALKSGGFWQPGQPTDGIDWVANQGTRISVILKRLAREQDARPHPALAQLLAGAVDPLAAAGAESTAVASLADLVAQPPQPPKPALSPDLAEPAQALAAPPPQAHAAHMVFTGPVTIFVGNTPASRSPQPLAAAALEAPEVGAEAAIRFDPDYEGREGYSWTFLKGFEIPHPKTSASRLAEMIQDDESGELVLHYHHYSLAMNRQRRLQMWSAANVDYKPSKRQWFQRREDYGSDKWIPDPRIPSELQIQDAEAYLPSRSLQRGHIVRRDDSAWGASRAEQERANSDTFHWTNCTPQHGGFNQSSHTLPDGAKFNGRRSYEGLWGAVENKVAEVAEEADGQRLIIFAGPVLSPDDDSYNWGRGWIRMPMRYWKIVIASQRGELGAYGFILSQARAFKDLGFERLDFGRFAGRQVAITEIQSATGVDFAQVVLDADTHGQ